MSTDTDPPPQPCTFSVLIGIVSTEDRTRIFEVLDALRKQTGAPTYEVIIADRRNDQISRRICLDYPEVRLIACPAGTSLPELRTLALDQANGEYIVVTEDHCIPSRNWLDSMAQAFREAPEGTAAVGGCVENGAHETALDWATFFCEYSQALSPVWEGVSPAIPGMNVAYRRTVLEELDRELLVSGFWETTVHPVLLKQGMKLLSTNKIELFHCKKFSFGLFVAQRFIYSRYYAGLRFGSGQLLQRAAAFVGSIILPPLLLYRIFTQVWKKNRLRRELLSAFPALSIFVIIWMLGEMVGYLLGSGDALARIE